jgi:hypothetical protein
VAPWKLPLVVAAIAVPIAVAFYFGGPGVGVAIGALVGVAIMVWAVRQRPRGAIGEPADGAGAGKLLVVVGDPLEDAAAIAAIAEIAAGEEASNESAEVMVLAPARLGFFDRWASDVEGARRDAQQRLVLSVASLAAAGIEAEARVGDEDVVQAVEDQLGSFAATAVVLVTAAGEEDAAVAEAASELRERLRAEFRWIVVSDPATR